MQVGGLNVSFVANVSLNQFLFLQFLHIFRSAGNGIQQIKISLALNNYTVYEW